MMRKINTFVKAMLLTAITTCTQTAVSQVVINEISTNSDTIEVFGQTCDWIEIYNPTPGYAFMHGFAISDDPNNPQKWQFPDNYKLEPYGFLMVLCNDQATGANTNFKLSAKGETIILSDKNGNIVDQVIVPPLLPDQTYGRAQDGSRTWGVFKEATPFASNNSSEAYTTPPTVDIEGGFFTKNQSVRVTCTDPDAEIRYSTNGDIPHTLSKNYPATFTINKNTVLRVSAKNPDLKISSAVTNTYFINNRDCDLPVVSLSTDPANFYNSFKGIYVKGEAGIPGNCIEYPANWNQDWERPIHFEYFDKEHNKKVSLDAGVKIFGKCSRANAMKSLRIVARKKDYGAKRIECKFFEDKDIDKFKSIVLRNGGNDFPFTFLRDGIITQLCAKHMDVDVQAFQPAAVYLNGEYLGLHNIREKISEHYIEENYGLDDNDIDLLEDNAQIIEGSNDSYKALINYVESHSLADDANFEYVSKIIDINNYTDYVIAQLYIDNEDWPNNNIKYWKTKGKDSKWRWILFGTEYSIGIYGKGPSDNSIKRVLVDKDNALGNSAWSSVLIKALLTNEKYRNMFLQRFAFHIQNTFSPYNFNQMADSLTNLIYKEWEHHSKKWYPENNQSRLKNGINQHKSWNQARQGYIWDHLAGVFDVNSPIYITVKTDNEKAQVLLDGYKAKDNISSKYFPYVPMTLSPSLPDGIAFDKWIVANEETTVEYNTPDLTIEPTTNLEITLVTKEAQPMEFCEIKSDGQLEFVELYNNSEYSFNLSGYKLTGNINFEFAQGTIIPANGYVVVSNQELQSSINQLFTEGNIGTSGNLVLRNTEGEIADSIAYSFGAENWPSMPSNGSVYLQSYGIDNNDGANWLASEIATPGQQSRFVSAKGLIISEICSKNAGIIADEYNQYPGWIEIRNMSDSEIDLAGLYLGDGKNYYTIPYNQSSITKIAPGFIIVFFADEDSQKGILHTNFKLNTNGGKVELIQVVNGTAEVLDAVEYPKLSKNQSFGVAENNTRVKYSLGTPYAANNGTIVSENQTYTVASSNIATPVAQTSMVQNSLTIYPNPATKNAQIKDAHGEPHWIINSLNGSTVKSGSGENIDLDGLKSGYYIIKITDGNNTETHKIIKI